MQARSRNSRPRDISHGPTRGGGGGNVQSNDVTSANGQTVLQAALGPQRIEPARDLQRRALADIALKAFAVIALGLDDAIGPVVGQAEPFTELAFEAEQAADFRIG